MERLGRIVNSIEETLIAGILGVMTLITFANVIARYVFNDNILWALETTVFLFAWLVLIGMSYCVKITAHLGVDAVVTALPPRLRKIATLLAVAACLLFALLLLKGSWDYWSKFAFQLSFLETNDVPMPSWLQWIATYTNDGEAYEKLPRFVPYFALPLGVALLLFRFLEAGWRIVTDRQALIIVSHEVEDAIEDAAAAAAGNPGKANNPGKEG